MGSRRGQTSGGAKTVVIHRRATRIALLHPELGLGGAERLVVDAALELQQRGHAVTIFTATHDRARAFPETTDGREDREDKDRCLEAAKRR